MPLLKDLWQDFAPRGLIAYSVSSNILAPDDPETVADYVAEMGLTMTTLIDYDVTVYDAYRITDSDGFAPYPREFIVDRDGTVLYAAATIDAAAMAEVLDAALD